MRAETLASHETGASNGPREGLNLELVATASDLYLGNQQVRRELNHAVVQQALRRA